MMYLPTYLLLPSGAASGRATEPTYLPIYSAASGRATYLPTFHTWVPQPTRSGKHRTLEKKQIPPGRTPTASADL